MTQQLLDAAAHFEIDAPGNGRVKLKRVTAASESESARAVQDWAPVVTVAAHMSELRGGGKKKTPEEQQHQRGAFQGRKAS